jgi:two-component system, NarL family, response regulator LiaR
MMKTPIRVLLVDDDVTILHALRGVLKFAPALQIVGEAHSGEEAVKFTPLLRLNVVVMGVELPCMDGLEATRLIKQHWPQVEVVLLATSLERAQEAQAEGVTYYLQKGSSIETLVDAITASFCEEIAGSSYR